MANVPKKPKQKTQNGSTKEELERDALAFAEFLYDVYQDKKRKEQNNDVPPSI